MEFLTELWMAMVVASVLVFVVSSITHMVLPLHKKDVTKMPNEEAVVDSLRSAGVGPGAYMFPGCKDMKEWNTQEQKAKLDKGPIGWLTVLPQGGFNMGRSLLQWFVYSLFVSVFTGYVAWNSLQPGAAYLEVFQVAGAAAFMAYGLGSIPESIWKGVRWSVTFKFVFDGLLYALVTAGAFAWRWPEIASAVENVPAL
jgi:hypothetical protein